MRRWMQALVDTARRDPWPALLAASLGGWILIAMGGPSLAVARLCGGLADGRATLAGLSLALDLSPPGALAWSWFVMLLAMTPPLLAQPVRRLWRGSLRRQRAASVAAFLAGYAGAWMAAGAVLVVAALMLRLAADGMALALSLAAALAWQATPAKRTCLLRCHAAPSLRAFGPGAQADSLRYGLTLGGWCVGACWPLMLVPLTADGAHLPAMVLAAAVMFVERHAPVREPAARLRLA